MTAKTRANFKTDKDTAFADNTSGGISAGDLRGEMDHLVDSAILPEDLLDEDDMSSDSATEAPTQQSVKAYVDGNFIADTASYTGTASIYPTDLYVRTSTYGGTGATTSVIVGAGSTVQYTRTGDMSAPGHCLGLLGRIQVQSAQTVSSAWAVEGRVDPEAVGSAITEGVAFKVIVGDNTENDGTITGLYGLHMQDYSGASYNYITNKAIVRNDDPDAHLYNAARTLGAYNTAAGYTTGGELAPAMMAGAASGTYIITPGAYDFTAGASPLVANIIYATPIFVPKRTTIDGIAATVTTGSAGAARLGLYFEENGIPTDLVIDAGTIDTTSVSDTLVASISDTVIEAGWYFAAWVSNSTPNVRTATSLSIPSLMGQTNMSGGSVASSTPHTPTAHFPIHSRASPSLARTLPFTLL